MFDLAMLSATWDALWSLHPVMAWVLVVSAVTCACSHEFSDRQTAFAYFTLLASTSVALESLSGVEVQAFKEAFFPHTLNVISFYLAAGVVSCIIHVMIWLPMEQDRFTRVVNGFFYGKIHTTAEFTAALEQVHREILSDLNIYDKDNVRFWQLIKLYKWSGITYNGIVDQLYRSLVAIESDSRHAARTSKDGVMYVTYPKINAPFTGLVADYDGWRMLTLIVAWIVLWPSFLVVLITPLLRTCDPSNNPVNNWFKRRGQNVLSKTTNRYL